MLQSVRVALAATLLALLSIPASAQTLKLTVHVSGDTPGTVTMVSGGLGSCTSASATCTFDVETGATVRIAAPGLKPGRFSGGTGPAAGCSLSTCSFAMTAAADLTATFTSGDGPLTTLTVTFAGGGLVIVDGVACQAPFTCSRTYLQGSSVHLDAGGPAGAVFTGYTGSSALASVCGVTSPVCDFTLSSNTATTANFMALSSFTVTPANAFGGAGGPAQQFSATGFFSGGSLPITGKGSWASTVNMPFKREFLGAAALGGKIYALGGSASGGTSAGDVAVYNPGSNPTWTVAASLLVPRRFPAAVAAGGFLYAIGGYSTFGSATATVERYDPVLDTWTLRAQMSSPRYGLVAGAVNGIIYAAGGSDASGAPVATLEAYDPVTNTWTTKAPMPAARGFVAGGVIDGIFYVVGGTDGTSWSPMVQAYDPATNTWTEKSRMPVPLSGAASAVADGVLYVLLVERGGAVMFAYDPVADAWTAKAPPLPRGFRAAAALDGAIYVIGGAEGSDLSIVSSSVDYFVDSLRWSSSAPAVARIDQTGRAIPLSAGTATITVAVGTQTCGASCPTFIVPGPSDMSLDAPANNTSVPIGTTLTIGGWALNKAALSGTGVDAIHVYAVPDAGNAIFLGVAPYGEPRPDVGAVFGSQFTNSGFTLRAGSTLVAGAYTIVAFAHNALTQLFDAAKTARVTITPPVSNPFMYIDTPVPGQTVTSAFEVGGWAIDTGAASGTGVDAVHCYVFPNDGAAPGVFIGSASYGWSRSDVGTVYGTRFTASGYHFTITGMGPGKYLLGVYAHSTVTNSFSIVRTLHFTVSATALMSIDVPSAEATITAPAFGVAGWAIDRTDAGATDTGVDALHVYAYPNPGSGQAPIFLGVATLGIERGDVAAVYGERYRLSGYVINVDRTAAGLTPGVYDIVVWVHSSAVNAFNNVAVVRVILQ